MFFSVIMWFILFHSTKNSSPSHDRINFALQAVFCKLMLWCHKLNVQINKSLTYRRVKLTSYDDSEELLTLVSSQQQEQE